VPPLWQGSDHDAGTRAADPSDDKKSKEKKHGAGPGFFETSPPLFRTTNKRMTPININFSIKG
jgi:hypothetical protein